MIRDAMNRQLDHDPNFQWRGEAVTRIENLSDIVFALALGMLVSASVPPAQVSMLSDHLLNIIPVTAGFAVLLSIWSAHFTFFRRYGVADRAIIFLNAMLLLVILFLAYPLRFIFDALFAYVLSILGHTDRIIALGITSSAEAGTIMGYFAAGYTVAYLIVHAIYAHALAKGGLLGLTLTERVITRRSIWIFRSRILLGSAAALMAIMTPVGAYAGFLLTLAWPVTGIVGRALPLPPGPPAGTEQDLPV